MSRDEHLPPVQHASSSPLESETLHETETLFNAMLTGWAQTIRSTYFDITKFWCKKADSYSLRQLPA